MTSLLLMHLVYYPVPGEWRITNTAIYLILIFSLDPDP
jgi:hypothetical protein